MIYPDAHLLGLPREIRELIYNFLTDSHPPAEFYHKNVPLEISATNPPPLSVLLTHRTLFSEFLHHFKIHTTLTIHIDAYSSAKRLDDDPTLYNELIIYHHIKSTRTIELRPRLNAGYEHIKRDLDVVVTVLLKEARELRTVIVGWGEMTMGFMGLWRPWCYKAPALGPVRGLVGVVEVVCGKVVMPPPSSAVKEQEGLERAVRLLIEEAEGQK
ncbi:hypothetical protein EJ08DRAFT_693798 [Tothia fuscella]|uniref:Uncharacterized protein n=1 Tax=Tothia fuscella TaxID=1048955 RepID=A0A9P4U1W6_9PEZI|nr:hypothetical protein EJ08DRAFT_693798 [Tothia fuscella]